MPATLPAHHPVSNITEADLQHFANLVPPSGSALLRMLGVSAGLSLLNVWAGVQVVVPKGPCNNAGGAKRWAQMVAIVGEDAMGVLAREMGGEVLEVPTLDALRKERRNHAIRTQFDRLTAKEPAGEGLSKGRAVQELGLSHAPITWRQLEVILDRPSAESSQQNQLFSDLF
ncbi:MAG: hypothetical protein ABI606_05340 [Rhodoferax sp.]